MFKFKGYEIYSIHDFKQAYENESQGYFFSKDTMAFFKSRIVEWSRIGLDKEGQFCIYFITSEKKGFESTVRVHSVRKGYVNEDGKLSVVTLEYQLGTLDKCKKYIKGLVNEN